MSNLYCIYCDKYKPKSNFSDEHIWPNALGGDYLPPIWRLEVCTSCNSVSGLFVDGAFVRNFFVKNQTLESPYNYFGKIREHTLGDDKTIDVYLGKFFNVSHVREKEGESHWQTQVGGNPINRNKKEYYSHIYISVNEGILENDENHEELKAGLKKLIRKFGKARFFINVDVINESRLVTFDVESEEQRSNLIFLDSIGKKPNLEINIQTDFESRFLSKLSLAIGYKLLGDTFKDLEYTEVVRRHFREANFEKRAEFPILQSGFFEKLNVEHFFENANGKWLLNIQNFDPLLVLLVKSPNGNMMSAVIANYDGVTNDLPSNFRSILHSPVWLIDGMECEEVPMSTQLFRHIETFQATSREVPHQVRDDSKV